MGDVMFKAIFAPIIGVFYPKAFFNTSRKSAGLQLVMYFLLPLVVCHLTITLSLYILISMNSQKIQDFISDNVPDFIYRDGVLQMESEDKIIPGNLVFELFGKRSHATINAISNPGVQEVGTVRLIVDTKGTYEESIPRYDLSKNNSVLFVSNKEAFLIFIDQGDIDLQNSKMLNFDELAQEYGLTKFSRIDLLVSSKDYLVKYLFSVRVLALITISFALVFYFAAFMRALIVRFIAWLFKFKIHMGELFGASILAAIVPCMVFLPLIVFYYLEKGKVLFSVLGIVSFGYLLIGMFLHQMIGTPVSSMDNFTPIVKDFDKGDKKLDELDMGTKIENRNKPKENVNTTTKSNQAQRTKQVNQSNQAQEDPFAHLHTFHNKEANKVENKQTGLNTTIINQAELAKESSNAANNPWAAPVPKPRANMNQGPVEMSADDFDDRATTSSEIEVSPEHEEYSEEYRKMYADIYKKALAEVMKTENISEDLLHQVSLGDDVPVQPILKAPVVTTTPVVAPEQPKAKVVGENGDEDFDFVEGYFGAQASDKFADAMKRKTKANLFYDPYDKNRYRR